MGMGSGYLGIVMCGGVVWLGYGVFMVDGFSVRSVLLC